LFKSKQRTAAAWAKGLMLGKAVGARDERDRIIKVLQERLEIHRSMKFDSTLPCACLGYEATIEMLEGKND
jgi:hypothetical protein